MKKILYLFLITSMSFGCDFAAGSYPYAEIYTVDVSEANLAEKIKHFKEENQQYEVPSEVGLTDGRSDKKGDHWYHIYFYFKDNKQIVYTWLRSSGEKTTTFALVSVNQGLQLGKWRSVNHDLSSEENKLIKEKFEKLILNKLK